MKSIPITSLALVIVLLSATTPWSRAAPPSDAAREIEVCFVLDTTGSMSGLIEGAKQKIWAIANQIISAKPTPKVRLALIGYRDRGDEYITRLHDLTDDIDAVYGHLQRFSAGGGGDGPESVNQALHEAVTKITWNPSREVLKIIFLTGDFPPHMDYPDDVKYPQTCQEAVKRDLIINTIQCGNHGPTTPIWQEIARLAEGSYVQIAQSGDMVTIATPMDEELAKLNVEVGRTLVAYGSVEQRREVASKQAAAESAAAPVAAERLTYNLTTGQTVQGGGDLLDDLARGRVKLEDVADKDLPQAMQSMTAEQRQAYLKEQADQRAKLQARMSNLLKQRSDYLEAERKKLAGAGKGDAFDAQVTAIVRDQAARKKIQYE